MKLVRWLGAFRDDGHSFEESLVWELTQTERLEVAAEPIRRGEGSSIRGVRVGLLVRSRALVKAFRGDCWSEEAAGGRLFKTRNPRHGGPHLESWVRPDFAGIVIKGNPRRFPRWLRRTIARVAARFGLPIYQLDWDGNLREVRRI